MDILIRTHALVYTLVSFIHWAILQIDKERGKILNSFFLRYSTLCPDLSLFEKDYGQA